MKIVFTGGGTGGHFYPIIAVAEAIRDIVNEKRLITPRLYYIAPTPFDEEALFENEIQFIRSPAGKIRRYSSIENITDIFLTGAGILHALFTLLLLYPDIVVSKGGYASVPTVIAAKILGIPILIHESDAKPGKANLLAASFAARIALAFPSAKKFFPEKVQEKIAVTGIPIRKELMYPETEGARQYLNLEQQIPTVLILGGSSGAKRINDVILDALPELVVFSNVVHQTGKEHYEEVEKTVKVIISGDVALRYHPFPYLNLLSLRRAAGAADIVISRAGATAIAEIALWGKPSILIPIPEDISHDQRTNAYAYAHTGAATVLEEANLTPHLLVSEIKRIIGDAALYKDMSAKTVAFKNTEAARIIADEIVRIGLSHEK
jgi:UDP-N-acetylglucosamine--N-acetylmuramyl-(pentapeptide) pyrophosphoryl-undecaprenol N-acetylglucosamine transferase